MYLFADDVDLATSWALDGNVVSLPIFRELRMVYWALVHAKGTPLRRILPESLYFQRP